MRKALGLSLALTVVGGTALAVPSDKYNITPQEHAACDGDAISLCAWTYPDEDNLLLCMKGNRDKLSPTCAAVFAAGLKRRHLPF